MMALALATPAAAGPNLPGTMAALGDSFTRAWGSSGTAADNVLASWSTGTDVAVDSHYLRLKRLNSALSGNAANYAKSGSKMSATTTQADSAIAFGAQYVTVLSGINDVCSASTVSGMTSVATYSSQLNGTISKLVSNLPGVQILVASVPDLYGFWQRFNTDPAAQDAWAARGTCPLIFGASTSADDRAAAGQRIVDYNSAAAAVCANYSACAWDANRVFSTYGTTFTSSHVTFDYVHPSKAGQALLSTAAWDGGPYALDVYGSFHKDSGCSVCSVGFVGAELQAKIAGGDNALDTAFGLRQFAGSSGWSGRLWTRTYVRLEQGETLGANLFIVEVRDKDNKVAYQLYLDSARRIRFKAPAGGLRGTVINVNTGVVVPNNGTTKVRIEVSALRNDSVIVRVNGVDKLVVPGLSGATTGNPRYLRAGIVSYATSTTNEPVTIYHSGVAATTADWLGP